VQTELCNGVHPGDSYQPQELAELDIVPQLCTRRGRRIADQQHAVVGKHPILVALDDDATRGRKSAFRLAVEQVLEPAMGGNDISILLRTSEPGIYPNLRITATWNQED
jgi:hypothetical protein